MQASYAGLLTLRRIATLRKIGRQETLDAVIFQLPEIKKLGQSSSSIKSFLWSHYLNIWHSALLQLSKGTISSKLGVYSTRDINNDPEINYLLKKLKSQIIVIRGGRILNSTTLDAFNGLWINIHGGILPQYRGLDSHIWAVSHGHLNQVGVTAHVATSKVDSGSNIRTTEVDVCPDDTWAAVESRIENAADDLHVWFHNLEVFPAKGEVQAKGSTSSYFGTYKPRPKKCQKIRDFQNGK